MACRNLWVSWPDRAPLCLHSSMDLLLPWLQLRVAQTRVASTAVVAPCVILCRAARGFEVGSAGVVHVGVVPISASVPSTSHTLILGRHLLLLPSM